MEARGARQGMRGTEHKVVTKTLREAVEQLERKEGDLANVFAIVDECTLPKQSRGSDYFVRMNLYDESTSSSGWERPRLIELMVFSKQLHKLPTSVVPKSIIRLQNVKIQWYNKDVGQEAVRKPQLCGRVGLGFQYQLFHHSEGSNSDAPFMTAEASNLKVTAADKDRLAQLRQYSIKLQLKDMAPLADASQTYLRKVFELWTVVASPTPLLVDVICQILAIDKRLHPLTVVHVWDGTDLPPVSEGSSSGQVANPHTTLPQRRHALPLLSSAAGVEVCQQLPQLGTAVPLLLSRNSALPEVGSWVKVKCVSTIAVQGQLQLLEHERTQIAERTTTVGTWLSNYDERVKNNQVSQPTPLAFQSSCVCSSDLQPQTVRQLLQSVHAGIPGVFRLHARVVRYHPQDLAHALVPLEELWLPQQECTEAALACGHTFAIKLLLEDATGQVDAVLLGRDAEQFFQGLPPFPPNRPDQVSKLQEWLSLLAQEPAQAAAGPSGDGSDAGGGAWLDCCVKLAFLDQVGQGPEWVMPSIRMVQTKGRSPAAT